MAFLDNSGDIVLDAVLTDTGRHRMARGDFRITKFSLGDDEIDYSLYNKNHPSGSAYYDLEILKTPILESFTNNSSMLKSKLLTIGRTDFLYMPQLKLMDGGNPVAKTNATTPATVKATQMHGGFRSYVVTVDHETDKMVRYNKAEASAALVGTGIILGPGNTAIEAVNRFNGNPNNIQVETGIDTPDISPKLGLAADLSDIQFIIEIDSRLGSIVAHADQAPGGARTALPISYVDDDGIASYIVSGESVVFSPLDDRTETAQQGQNASDSRIRGPRGKRLKFTILPHTNLRDSNYFFTRLGGEFQGTGTADDLANAAETNAGQNGFDGTGSQKYRFIDTFVRVIGMTTGYTIDIPVRYVKKKS